MNQHTDWHSIDWNLCDADIVKITGRTRQRVNQVRKALNKPKSINHLRKLELYEKKCFYMEAIRQSETPKHLSEKFGFTYDKAYHIWRRLAKETGKHQWKDTPQYKEMYIKKFANPWHLMNPDLPNADLARIWRIKEPNTQGTGFKVASRRARGSGKTPLSGTKPKWDLRFAATHTDGEYLRAVEEERKKADEFYKGRESGNT